VGSSERIKNVADIIVNDDSERKLVVVSAMSKVTDMMYDLIDKAQSRDESYISALDAVLEKHKSTALDLLEGDDLARFLSRLHHDISNLKAMLRAIYIGMRLFLSLSLLVFTCVRKNIIVGPNLYPLNNLLYFKPMPDIVIFSLKIGTLACFMIAHIQLDLSCYLDIASYLFIYFISCWW
jgi:hypothetical protein